MNFSDNDLVYIKSNLVIEPLFDNWYAWSHLISPATSAMNIYGRHLTIMESFLKYPELHEEAVKNPKMLGGPFVDHPASRVNEIKSMVENTKDKCANLLTLRKDILALFELLKKENGYSLDGLYDKIPKNLDGLVELFYDINNNASFRFFESLLYETEFYNEDLQSFNLFLVQDDDSRSFVLSTPFLPTPGKLRINLPLKSKEIDTLFEMAREPQRYGDIKSLFNLTADEQELFDSFFTTEAPKVYEPYKGDGILTRYFGHACILVETKNTTILADPLISYGYDSDISRYTYEDLPETIDYAVITHNHQDHILLETLLRLRSRIKNIVIPKNSGGTLQDPSLKLMFKKLGFKNIIELGEMETIDFEDCSITGLPFLGEHSDLDVRSKLCHHVKFKDDKSMLFAADSCNVSPSLYRRIKDVIGNIDVIFLGMECHGAPLSWLYGPLLPEPMTRENDQSRRLAGCDFEQARELIDTFQPKDVFVYAMGLEPWLQYISSIKYTEESKPIIESNKLLEYCSQNGISSERLFGEKIIEYTSELSTS
ncbi:L-ascorbate metabolism protein UlaG (beta-lactamase superfamily) [Kordia periserrulae]|uniref:L-ascorbate metabolism protein UlaG (Beta-lactamase superfamily) n=1 Tax=Kordia periserrulae TaxID=701523 RepID=A0A2T6BQN9_9FLAO|nr:MBL fold metallo-hydrolase [Kordia periserrulae]PTX58413.1 L-ascorbate metabolism protein UlaG (beta-lactamase superfamily) [Kordia periserrulae]